MINSILQKLDVYNDIDFKFDPIRHRYTLNDVELTSVTRFISRFHKDFDVDYWSNKKSDDSGIPQDLILKEWKKNNDRSNFIGTTLHNFIENYFNKIPQDLPIDIDIIDRINKFNILYAKNLHKLTPIKFEQRIFSKRLKIAGMIDSIFLYKDSILVLDWKSNKKFDTDDSDRGRFEKLLYPFDNFWKNHLNEYSIQISMYIMILKEIGIDVKQGYLVHIGPDCEGNIHKCHNFVNILEKYFIDEKLVDLV